MVAKFEMRIINAFSIIDKDYGYSVYPDLAKLRILQRMVRCDSLKTIKATISYQMSIEDRSIDFSTALVNYREAVETNNSNSMNTKRSHRNISTSMSTKPTHKTQDDIKGSWTVNGIDGKAYSGPNLAYNKIGCKRKETLLLQPPQVESFS